MKSSISLLIIAVCIASYFVYIKPMSAEIRGLNAKKDEYNNILDRVKEINEKRDAVSMEYDTISQEELDRLNKIIPEKIDSTILSNDVSSIARKYGMSLKEFKVVNNGNANQIVESNSSETYKTTTVTMKLSGQYNQFLSLLEEMEYGLNLIDVTNLIIKQGSETNNLQAQMDYTLEFKTYSLR